VDVSPLEPRHKLLIGVIADVLRDHSAWPRYDYVEAVLEHEHQIAIEDALVDLPPELAHSQSGNNPQATIVATVPGLAGQYAVQADLERFIRIIAKAAEAEQTFLPSPVEQRELKLTRDIVLADLGEELSPADVKRLGLLLNIERPVSFSGQADGEWALQVYTSEVRAYRGVSDLADYIARRPQPPRPPTFLAPAPPRPSIFVVMPFNPSWASNVYDSIGQACREVAQSVSGLQWIRADDIDEPGRITDQIVNAILNADLIIADVTDHNPNVMFELGYADAARKPIIVLNQHIDESPFDIKDWRQIHYSPDELADARERLVSFIRGQLTLHTRQT